MRVALVGLGYWGSKLIRNLTNQVGPEHVVAVDSDADRLADMRRLYPQATFVRSIEEALEDPEVAAAIVATPLETHERLARTVLAARRHVLVEKPLASSSADAHGLCRLADDQAVTLMVGHTFLFSPRVNRVAEYVRKGVIGRVHYATSSRLNLGLHRRDANVIWDLAPHDFSILFHVLEEFPLSVQTAARSLGSGWLPDVAFANLSFPSGTIVSVALSWVAPRKVRNTVVVGDRGMVVYDDTQPDEPVKVYDRGVQTIESASFGEHQLTYRYGDTVSPHVSAQEPLSLELEHFFDCIQSGSRPLSDGWFGLQVVRVLEAADRSWRIGGTPVSVDALSSDAA